MNVPILYLIGLVIFLGNYDFSNCLRMQVIPEVPSVTFIDPKYAEDVKIKTRRNGRRGEYTFNMEFTIKHYWANHNVSIHFIFYEYLHNEYRPSFVELHYKLCDLILKDQIIGLVIRKTGMTTCPVPPGRYHMMNMTFNQEFPSIWPFEKGKCVLIIKSEPSGKEIAKGDLVMVFKMIKS